MRKLMFASCLAVAILLTDSWLGPSLAQKTARVPAATKQELLKAAKAHGVSIKADKIAYVNNQKMTIVRAPIEGIEKYSDADFAAGAPIELLILKSKTKLAVPDGSYVVKVQYQRQPPSGKAIFTDAAGAVVAERDLDRPVLILPDPNLPDRNDHGDSGIDSCSIFREMFLSLPCRDCACDTYNWRRSRPGEAGPPGGIAPSVELAAWFMGRDAGVACMAAPTPTCSPLPVQRPDF